MPRHHLSSTTARAAVVALALTAAVPVALVQPGGAAAAPTWTAVGPAVAVREVATAPSDPSVVYAAGTTGVLRSDDGGLTWSPTALTDSATDVAVDRSDPDVVYAIVFGDDELWRSGDAGATWENLSWLSSGPGQGQDVTVTGDHVVVMDRPNNLTWSEGSGWSAHNEVEFATDAWGNEQEWGSSSTAYAVAATDGLMESAAPATIWLALNVGLVQYTSQGNLLAPIPAVQTVDVTADGSRVLAGSHLSSDGGATWAEPAGTLSGSVRASEIDDAAAGLDAYVGLAPSNSYNPAVYRATATGWQSLGLDGVTVDDLDAHDGRLLAATPAGLKRYAETAPPVPPGSAEQVVTGGETVTTDPTGTGATSDVPLQTAIAVPPGVSGTVSVTPVAAGDSPDGYALLGQELVLSGPAATAASPYTVTFTVDVSLLGGTAPADVQVFRNGALVLPCEHATSAVPDPCLVSSGEGAGGDAVVVARTSQFSTWSLGRLDYALTGPFAPVDALPTVNTVKAGAAVPVKLSLGGDRGLDVLADGYPVVVAASCTGGVPDAVEQTTSASSSSLTYADGVYQYTWKTTKGVTGCRDLVLRFRDGTELVARFSLR